MDFFADQHRYHRRSSGLLALFALAVLTTVVAVDAIINGFYYALAWLVTGGHGRSLSWHALVVLSLIQLAIIAGAAIWRIRGLRGGGCSVAMDLGATPIPASPDHLPWRRLRDVVEEIGIASGVPVFNIFVLEDEPGINAFAAGYTTSDAAICVTQGALDKLTRDELQGVIAHELSHVVNGDMRLNIRLLGLLFGIHGFGVIGHKLLDECLDYSRGRTREQNDNSPVALGLLAGMAAVTYGAVGSVCARLVQAAVARTRESLADACAVQYTRQTQGIAGALKKIAALRFGSGLRTAGAREVAHMLFGSHRRGKDWFATHPPLSTRLRALGVRFSDAEAEQLAQAWNHPRTDGDPTSPSASLSGFVSATAPPPGTAPTPTPATEPAIPPLAAAEQPGSRRISHKVGQTSTRDLDLATNVARAIPAPLRAAAMDAQRAAAVLLCLLLDGHTTLRVRQLDLVAHGLGAQTARATDSLYAAVSRLDPMARLPLASLAVPSLRRQPRPQLLRLLATMEALVHGDAHVSLDEYCLMRLVGQQLRDLLDPAAGFRPGTRRLRDCRDDFTTLAACVARQGNPGDDEAAERAFAAGMRQVLPDWQSRPEPPADWQTALDKTLGALDHLRAFDKQMVIDGIAATVNADGVLTVAESELLRVICAILHCPLPLLHSPLEPAAT
ncbi:MAG TPA: M48 family metalloprotease [Rhodanobacteraceae bacterium]